MVINVSKSQFLPERKSFNSHFVKQLLVASPKLDTALDDWGETPDKALSFATKTFTNSYGPDHFRKLLVAVFNDFYDGGAELEWIDLVKKLGYAITEFSRANDTKHYILYDTSVITSMKLIST